MPAVQAASCKPSTTFWLELTGEKSLDSHQYALVDGEGGEAIQLAPSSEYKGRRGPILAAEICESKPRSLVLQLEGKETIDLTLIPQEPIGPHGLKAPQRNDQDNLMVSVHPTLFCDSGELTQPRPVTGYEESIPGPIRTGWIYVFFNGRLWREVLVQTAEKAAPTFKDTNLSSARAEDGTLQSERLPTGPELDVIHVPAKLLGKAVYDKVYLAFSEVQWSPAYIAELEGSETYLKERCRGATAVKAFLERQPSSLYNDWKIIDDLPPMRARDNTLEHDVVLTGQWLSDVDGSRTKTAQQALIEQRNAIEKDQDVVEADYYIAGPSLYPRWRLLHLEESDLPQIETGQDVFESLRERHLLALHLRDPLQAARHLSQQLNGAAALLLSLVNNVKKRPFGTTAELFHNNFRRETLPDGTANPLYIEEGWFNGWMDTRIDYTDAGRLKRTVYDIERSAIREFLAQSQGAITRLVRDERAENLTSVFRDFFSQESGDAVAGYFQCDPLLQALSLTLKDIDPLRLPQETPSDSGENPQSLGLAIVTGEHPLGKMLLPHVEAGEEVRIAQASVPKLKAMVSALEDRGHELHSLEANVLREIADHQEEEVAPDVTAATAAVRSSFRTASPIAGSIANWWLSSVVAELKKSGDVFKVKVERIKGAFKGFADAAIAGRTRLQFEGADDGRWAIFIEALDEQGKVLTSGATAAAAYNVVDANSFNGKVQNKRIGRWLHQSATSPTGFPGILVVFDVWNLCSKLQVVIDKGGILNAAWVFSAIADLGISSANLISHLPIHYGWQERYIPKWQKEAGWFKSFASKVNAGSSRAETVARSRLGAAGYIAGNALTALMLIDTAKTFFNGHRREGFVKLAQTSAVLGMVNSDIIAARIATPAAKRVIESTSAQAIMRLLPRQMALAAGWTGTVASGWITAIGFGIFMWCERIRYSVMDDGVSQWLRAGPFSGEQDQQTDAYESEANAYLGLVKAMTPASFMRIPESRLQAWLDDNKLSFWSEDAAAVLSFASPVFTLTGKPVEIELELTYSQRRYRIDGINGVGGWDTTTLERDTRQLATRSKADAEVSGIIHQSVEIRYSESRQAIDFMIVKAQLRGLTAQAPYEHVETDYAVKRLKLTFEVDVWQRSSGQYESQEISLVMEDLDIERMH
ncbi:hypothetical protein EZI54_20355 [Marinobacter halodurans]|uniref:Uncharacterized protein n=1 Tax=Marinobacter halodurans TaxID=2528979 RepID=A0ABY1ZGM7_9GAMM|nr:hypothetical protein [Marinobacter halodurans]TBW48968.1 hypothetical protein EZI54_20355 [Marinobacter halodurans]